MDSMETPEAPPSAVPPPVTSADPSPEEEVLPVPSDSPPLTVPQVPSTSAPSASTPSVSLASTSAPSVSLDSTSAPSVSLDSTSAPSVSLDSTSALSVSLASTSAPSVSLASTSASASIAPFQPQPQLPQQQLQPVASRTRSQSHLGQPPFTPLSPMSSSATSSSYPSIQRNGLAIGVPALHPHHARPPQASYSFGSSSHFSQPFMSSSSPSQSFSQHFGGFPRGSVSLAEQSSGPILPSSSFSQPFSTMSRSSTGPPEQQSNSNSQFMPPVPGVQTIGMIGSLSSASRMRVSGIQHQQRLGQQIDKSIPPSGINQPLNLQKFPNPGLSRPNPMPSQNAPISTLQSAQSLQQQWIPNQGKQTHGTSSPSSSYRPPTKQHISQQRPRSPQQQQQQHSPPVTPNQLQVSSSQQQPQQQQQQQKQLQQHHQPQLVQQNISMPHHFQDLHSNRNQQLLPLQAPRGHNSIPQKSNNHLGQPVLSHAGITIPVTEGSTETGNQILSKRSIHELVAQIDPYEKLEPEVEDVLVEIADDFVESITTAACSLAKHRRSTILEAKDILLHVERNWNITLPGFGGDDLKPYKKPYTTDIHKERLSMIRKSVAIAGDAGGPKNVVAGPAAANLKAHASRAAAPASASPRGT